MLRKGLIVVGCLVFVSVAFMLLRNDSTFSPAKVPIRLEAGPKIRLEPPAPVSDHSQGPEVSDRRNEISVPVDLPASSNLPSLGESDLFVRERLESLSLPKAWIAQNHLLRRMAVLMDNATRGEFSRRQLDVLKPEGRFGVIMKDGRLYGDPNNARRFDAHLDRLEAVDPALLAGLAETLGPLIDDALEELGSTMSGSDTLRSAIDRIIEMPLRADALELVQPNVLYEYADPEIESLPPLEKQLLRLGPLNLGRLKAYLRVLRTAL